MSPAADGGARGFAVGFEDLVRWDIKSAVAALFRRKYEGFVPFGKFVEECTDSVRPGCLYPAITQDELAKIMVALPSPSKQKDIVKRMVELEEESNALLAEALKLEKSIASEIEAMILGEKAISP